MTFPNVLLNLNTIFIVFHSSTLSAIKHFIITLSFYDTEFVCLTQPIFHTVLYLWAKPVSNLSADEVHLGNLPRYNYAIGNTFYLTD
jgi:hypothetical protein